jgi:polyisoprenoid-binding protein YceI
MPAPAQAVRGIHGPTTGHWRIDPGHADVSFVGRHFGLTKIRGRFAGVSGEVNIADNIAESWVRAEIDVASLSSGDEARDTHLKSPDFFDVERFPTASFRSTRVRNDGPVVVVDGELTIRDVTRPVHLEVDYLGQARDPWENDRAVFSAATVLNREDWGLTWNMLLETGGLLVSKEIRIEIEVELVRA